MKVTLRQRLKGDKISLYLEYYSNGKRQYEYLNLYLTPDPEKGKLTNAVKEENKKILALAESTDGMSEEALNSGMKMNVVDFDQILKKEKESTTAKEE